MARDRLAGLRAQQGYQQRLDDNQPYGDGGLGFTGRPQYNDAHEMSSWGNGGGGDDDMGAFYKQIESLQQQIAAYQQKISDISVLQSRSLANVKDDEKPQIEAQLDRAVEDARNLSNDIKRSIQRLQTNAGSGRNGQIKRQQLGLVKQKFVDAIQDYQNVEKDFRDKYTNRLKRQYKIVNPNATPEEVQEIVESGNDQVFAQALQNSQRYGQASAAYNEVQTRHKEILKIEQTITQLAQLFNDMSVLVEQQDETLNVIEAHAAQVNVDTEAGLKHTEAAVDSAKAARKKRWICFWICVIIAIIVAIVVAVVVTQHINTNKSSG